jgi:2-keto-4-pentenoate hydratase/2-oxohepta-3-ene-1,7-dioic acid hydratase in catechol pathway
MGDVVRHCRVPHGGSLSWGVVEADHVRIHAGGLFAPGETVAEIPLAGAAMLAPVAPSKIVCVGLNYRAHAVEMGHPLPAEPVLFLKPPTACIGPGEPIVRPAASRRVDHEAELALVIGRRVRSVAPGEADAAIFGYTCANDVTARDLQARDGQWTRAKGFDTFCPLGPWIVAGIDPADLAVEAFVNGARRQASRTSDLIFGTRELVSFVSGIMTLEPGDVILTGTPAGVGPLAAGDVVEVRIEGIGALVNPVA